MLLIKTLKTICFSKTKALYCLNKFLLEFFALSGFPLSVEKCMCCGNNAFDKLYMNYMIGELECISCKHLTSEEVSAVVLSAIKFLNKTEFERLQTLKLAQDSELALLKMLVKNFEMRFDKRLNFIGILK